MVRTSVKINPRPIDTSFINRYKTFNLITDGKADERYGVCSNYLEGLDKNDEIQIFMRSAPSFHLPNDTTQPIILIGPGKTNSLLLRKLNSIVLSLACFLLTCSIIGTGTAPFRSFWQELDEKKMLNASFEVPKVWLFFGCRAKTLDLYFDEKKEMSEKGILDKVFLALSREVNTPKVS